MGKLATKLATKYPWIYGSIFCSAAATYAVDIGEHGDGFPGTQPHFRLGIGVRRHLNRIVVESDDVLPGRRESLASGGGGASVVASASRKLTSTSGSRVGRGHVENQLAQLVDVAL